MLNGQLLQLPVADNTIITPNSELVIKNQVRMSRAALAGLAWVGWMRECVSDGWCW